MHYFKKSLEIGKAGEAALQKLWPDLVPLDGRGADFFLSSTGETVEVKTDSYSMAATSNFFIELMRDVEKERIGGPAQALMHGSSLWVYWFIKDKVAFVFETRDLVAWLKENYTKYPQRNIKNMGWTTVGILVPREDLKALYTRRELNEDFNKQQ